MKIKMNIKMKNRNEKSLSRPRSRQSYAKYLEQNNIS